MRIQALTFNPFAENTYLIIGQDKNCIIVDPGMSSKEEQERFDQYIRQEVLVPKRLILTHAHIDHVLGLKAVHDSYGLIAEGHEAGKPVYDACPQVSQMYGIPYFPGPEPKHELQIEETIELDGDSLEMRYVPGHAPGHIVLIHHGSKQVVAGDTLFQESIGRTDLPGGDHQLLLDKIKSELFSLDDDYVIWPGHGPQTTIGHEKAYNPFLR